MKTTLIEAVMAHLAAKEMGRQILPYTLALAVVKVKQATQAQAVKLPALPVSTPMKRPKSGWAKP